MSDNLNRYLFTVRKNAFISELDVDTFYKVELESGYLDAEVLAAQEELLGNVLGDKIKPLGSYLTATRMRLRFNTDMFPHICMVKTEIELTREDLQCLLESHDRRGTLNTFLEEAKIT